uniref:Uncharacterized protein LOC114346007 n=1 Tax=Diabrotica virgifera virgifera TaxID=50390 RepID=A0A6P7GS02_DIAVI
MSDEQINLCVKCDERIKEFNQKSLKCNGNCNKSLHYTCSDYNTSQLEFLESNKSNVKWFCDMCSQNKQPLNA